MFGLKDKDGPAFTVGEAVFGYENFLMAKEENKEVIDQRRLTVPLTELRENKQRSKKGVRLDEGQERQRSFRESWILITSDHLVAASCKKGF